MVVQFQILHELYKKETTPSPIFFPGAIFLVGPSDAYLPQCII